MSLVLGIFRHKKTFPNSLLLQRVREGIQGLLSNAA
jgi:hypothetical protein